MIGSNLDFYTPTAGTGNVGSNRNARAAALEIAPYHDELVITLNGRTLYRGPHSGVNYTITETTAGDLNSSTNYYKSPYAAEFEFYARGLSSGSVKIGGRPPPPTSIALGAAALDAVLERWRAPNAYAAPRRRPRRRAARRFRPVRSRPGMRKGAGT